MTTVQEIKVAIDKLSPDEQADLIAWFDAKFDAWDRQIVEDAKAGKLDAWLKEVDAEIDNGNLREFP